MGAVIPANLRAQVRALDQERCAYCQSPKELTVASQAIEQAPDVIKQ